MRGVSVPDVFVDRKDELKRLDSYLADASEGNPTFIFISGEAGVGKAFLVEHFLNLNKENMAIFSYGATAEQRAVPYHAFAVFMERFSKMEDKDIGEIAAARLTKLRGMLGTEVSIVGDVAKEREVLFETFGQFFQSVSKERTIALFIDNLQWCDEGSILLIQHLAQQLEGCQLLLIATYRPEELDDTEETVHPITGLMATLMMQDRLNAFLLERFGEPETAQMLAAILGSDAPDNFVSFIHEKTEGSPIYIVELVGSILEQGIIDTSKPHWDEFDPESVRTPGGVKDIISRRLDHIDDDIHDILRIASVLGSFFSISDLCQFTECSESDLSKSMSEMIERKIVYEVLDSAKETYSFDHSKIRDVLYESLEPERKKELHRKIGEMLEARNRPLDFAYSMARHFYEAGDIMRGYRYTRLSGDLALGSHAPGEAYAHYMNALDLLQGSEFESELAKDRVELLTQIGDIGYRLGDWEKAISSLEEALSLARVLSDDRLIVNSLVALGDIIRFQASDNPRSLKIFGEALEIAEKAGFDDKIAEAHRGLGYVRWREGEFDKAARHYEVMIASAEKTGDRKMLGSAHVDMGNLFSSKGELSEAITQYEAAIKILEEEKSFFELARANNNIGDVFLQTKNWDKAIENFTKCGEIAEEVGLKDMMAWSLFNTAEALAKKGELDLALENCERAKIILIKMDDKVGLQGVEKNMAIIYRFMKDWDKAETHFEIAVKMAEELNYPHANAEVLIEEGQMFIDKGDKVKAKKSLDKAIAITKKIEAREMEARARKVMEDGGIT